MVIVCVFCPSSASIDPSRRYLYLYIKSGKAFLEHIEEDTGNPGQVASYFTFHVLFRGQRFKSRPVACACDPDIDEGFLLELHKDGSGMLQLCIHLDCENIYRILQLTCAPIKWKQVENERTELFCSCPLT